MLEVEQEVLEVVQIEENECLPAKMPETAPIYDSMRSFALELFSEIFTSKIHKVQEIVEIEECDRDGIAPVQFALHRLEERGPIGQTGQEVGCCLLAGFVGKQILVGHVSSSEKDLTAQTARKGSFIAG